MKKEQQKELAQAALEARAYSYVPYSGFAVGAALLTKEGRVIRGCNIENAAYSPTNCAERTAIFKAVSEGCLEFQAIAIAGGMAGARPEAFCPPCGVCLQVMSEFCSPEFEIYLVKTEDEIQQFQLKELLPMAFQLK